MHKYQVKFKNWTDHNELLNDYLLAKKSSHLSKYSLKTECINHLSDIIEKIYQIQQDQFLQLHQDITKDLHDRNIENIKSFKEFLISIYKDENFNSLELFFNSLIICDKEMGLNTSQIIVSIYYAEAILKNSTFSLQILDFIYKNSVLKIQFLQSGDLKINENYFHSLLLNEQGIKYLQNNHFEDDVSMNILKEALYFQKFPMDAHWFYNIVTMLTSCEKIDILEKYLNFFENNFLNPKLCQTHSSLLTPQYWVTIYETCNELKLKKFSEKLLQYCVLWVLFNQKNEFKNEIESYFSLINSNINEYKKTKLFSFLSNWIRIPSNLLVKEGLKELNRLLPNKSIWDLNHLQLRYREVKTLFPAIASCSLGITKDVFIDMEKDDSLQEIILHNSFRNGFSTHQFDEFFQNVHALKNFIWLNMTSKELFFMMRVSSFIACDRLEVLILDVQDYYQFTEEMLLELLKNKSKLKTLFLGKILPLFSIREILNIISKCCPDIEYISFRENSLNAEEDFTDFFKVNFLKLKKFHPSLKGIPENVEIKEKYSCEEDFFSDEIL